ncbi:hypothetical protein [Bartonella henselae]|uniref:Uncharacterized protein n=2 Tax=Bartonella henselae TaxID=38323 RepID=X5LMI6_BARHN|nr:hypothetical protein [Bartonella henselae]ETS08459.1 hypothetical protein Q655_00724 [Bartonella henselae JK 51]ETS08588.1 hypothetical protein Q655_00857 [Bartonella henselae JK 51]ETS09006.1 hypothetical protein Q654_00771 [Bartonella henselae JK 50]ETS09135.1 hypothetical protein Q654_00904 [Bartonella henselae JK 50]MDM9991177.1 hypothetical protein [Bartonella henselae]
MRRVCILKLYSLKRIKRNDHLNRKLQDGAKEASKNDAGEVRGDLIPPLALIEIGCVLEFGANNSGKGMDCSCFAPFIIRLVEKIKMLRVIYHIWHIRLVAFFF